MSAELWEWAVTDDAPSLPSVLPASEMPIDEYGWEWWCALPAQIKHALGAVERAWGSVSTARLRRAADAELVVLENMGPTRLRLLREWLAGDLPNEPYNAAQIKRRGQCQAIGGNGKRCRHAATSPRAGRCFIHGGDA